MKFYRRKQFSPNSSDTEEQSSEDEGDNWVIPGSRKRKWIKKIKFPIPKKLGKRRKSEDKVMPILLLDLS